MDNPQNTNWLDALALPWNALAASIHKNAVEHGWWEEPRTLWNVLALIHSEISEALEEYRDDMPMLWFKCDATEEGEAFICNDDCSPCKQGFITEGEIHPCIYKNSKPEGIAVELVDTVIRILDYCGYADIDIEAVLCRNIQRRADHDTYMLRVADDYPDFTNALHDVVSEASGEAYRDHQNHFAVCLGWVILMIYQRLILEGVNIHEMILLKHKYNETRPYRHGGKTC